MARHQKTVVMNLERRTSMLMMQTTTKNRLKVRMSLQLVNTLRCTCKKVRVRRSHLMMINTETRMTIWRMRMRTTLFFHINLCSSTGTKGVAMDARIRANKTISYILGHKGKRIEMIRECSGILDASQNVITGNRYNSQTGLKRSKKCKELLRCFKVRE